MFNLTKPFFRILLRRKKIWLSKGVGFKNTKFEGFNSVNDFTILHHSSIGFGSYIGRNCYLINTQIGRYCSIGSDVKLAIGKHPTSVFVSTHPAFFSTLKQSGFSHVEKDIFDELTYVEENKLLNIGNDVWIGSNVTIFDGVKIGDGAIIGAGSLVKHDIEPYSINVGMPSKQIKYRFEKDEIAFLMDLKWWDKDEAWVKKYSQYFSNIKRLREALNE